MNRTIKFRAWDKTAQKWRYSTDSDHVSYFWQFVEIELDYETEKTLTQYTGLKDCSGKEIFEGDIIRGMHAQWDEEYHEVVREVKINDEGFISPFYERINFEEEWWTGGLQDGFEVIGNKYENPDLLQKP